MLVHNVFSGASSYFNECVVLISSFIDFLSVVLIKHPDLKKKKLKEERVYCSLLFQKDRVHPDILTGKAQQQEHETRLIFRKQKDHSFVHTQKAERAGSGIKL